MSTKSINNKVECKECGHKDHILVVHIQSKHDKLGPDPVVAYLDKHPGAPLWSAFGGSKIREHSSSSKARMAPRKRKQVDAAKLFPDFGKAAGTVITGKIEIFDQPGPLTPELDEYYVFPEEQTLDLLTILEKPRRNRPYIKGWSGTGKTTLIFNLAAKIGAEVMEWNADSFQQRSSLIGRWIVNAAGETVFQYGILPKAMMGGYWLIINEIDTIDPHTLNVLKPVLEDPPRLTLLENDGEVIHAHPDFRVIATGNTWARGDATGMFVNTMVQSDADQRRWSARILLDYMENSAEKEMLKRYFGDQLEKEEPGQFVQVANKVREAFKAGKIDKTFSPAELVNWCENFLVCGKGPHHAARLSFLNSCEPAVATAISEMVIAVFGPESGTTSKDDD